MTWWPSNDAVYMYGPNLRAVFENVLPRLRHYDVTAPNLVNDVKVYLTNSQAAASMLQAKGKSERKQLVEMITNYQLMRGLIALFKLDPMLAFSSLREVSLTTLCGAKIHFNESRLHLLSYTFSSSHPILSLFLPLSPLSLSLSLIRVIVIDLVSVVSS